MTGLYKDVLLPETGQIVGTGWLSPMPDMRDYTTDTPQIVEMASSLNMKVGMKIPASVDLRAMFPPVENQLDLGSCTANAAVGMVEYCERKAFGKHIEGSRLFVYKATRNLMGVTGDTGAWLRNTMGALVLFGVPPENYWKYVVADFDKEPSAFVYAVADNYECLNYFCYDPLGASIPKATLLNNIKTWLAAGVPSMFGFYGFPSFDKTDTLGGIPFPNKGEKAQWGHAIVAAGFDDKKKIKNTAGNTVTTGALLIRNSWGTAWGDKGYGWLPYDYVLAGLAMDFWSLLSMEWVDTGKFGFD
ncbi:MAG: cysteine protease [ANME-2 cluster archaeon]|nr:MAG: cysteine protease [ANME-2 cluster archaeon]